MSQRIPVWPAEARDPFLEFWYARSHWLHHRTRNIVTARHYEDRMTTACCQLVDLNLFATGGSMPRTVIFSKPEELKC